MKRFDDFASETLPLLEEMNFEPFLKGNAANSTKTSRRCHILLRVAKAFVINEKHFIGRFHSLSRNCLSTAHPSFGLNGENWRQSTATKSSDDCAKNSESRISFMFLLLTKNKRMTSFNIKSQSLWTSVAECQWTLVIACRCCCLSISVSLCLHESRGGSLEKTNRKPFWSFF